MSVIVLSVVDEDAVDEHIIVDEVEDFHAVMVMMVLQFLCRVRCRCRVR